MNSDVGVYQIRCKRNRYVYIGSAERSMLNRWSSQQATLKGNHHHNKDLQRDWNRFGPDAFVFEVIEVCTKSRVRSREQYYLDKHFGNRCYNRQPNSRSAKGAKRDKESRSIQAAAAAARCTPEWRAAVSKRVTLQSKRGKFGAKTWRRARTEVVRRGENHPFYGKTGTAHPCYGRKSTPEQRKRYRQAALKREAEKRKERNRR